MKLNLAGINIDAISVGGHYTCIQFPNLSLAIDMGVCTPQAISRNTVLFTHAHSDHMAGVVRHCSSREMMGMKPPVYVTGSENQQAFEDMLDAWRRLNRSTMPCEVKILRPKETWELKKNTFF